MSATPRDTYEIRRVRLINFHNFLDETVTLEHGGHLFLLGDNASGKTTLLDAIHLVLTGADDGVELNAAARVAGARGGGRSLQGVVLRYNVERGALNEPGTIAYAAIELRNRQGRQQSLAIGLQATAMDVAPRKWGVLREGPLEALPLVIEELDGRRRPRDRDELRTALGTTTGFHGQLASYRQAVGERLFGGADLYPETCRLLRMGKAYRELVTSAGDYHELFKRLLPEPQNELFERIVQALQELEESRARLTALDTKVAYLEDLLALVRAVDAARDEQARLAWLAPHLAALAAAQEADRLAADQQAGAQQRTAVLAELQRAVAEVRALGAVLADLQQQDRGGFVRQERELTVTLTGQTAVVQQQEQTCAQQAKSADEHHRRLAAARQELAAAAHQAHQDLSRLAPAVGDALTAMIGALLALCQHATPEAADVNLPWPALRDTTRQAQASLHGRAAAMATRRAAAEQSQRDAQARLAALEREPEAIPRLAHWQEARAALHAAMVSARPLYAGLEWQGTVSSVQCAAVEELIGEDLLGMFLVPATEYAVAAPALWPAWSAIRLAPLVAGAAAELPGGDAGDLARWLRQHFDFAASDPLALQVLAEELAARRAPEFTRLPDIPGSIVAWRAHRRHLPGHSARLIGRQLRARRQAQEIREAKAACATAEQPLRELVREERELAQERVHWAAVQKLGDQLNDQWLPAAGKTRELATAGVHLATRLGVEQARLTALRTELAHQQERIKQLRELIRKEGLADLEERVRRQEHKVRAAEALKAEVEKRLTLLEHALAEQQVQERAARARQADCEAARTAREAALRARHPELTDIAYHVLHTNRGQQFRSVESVQTAVGRAQQDQARSQGELRGRLGNATGTVYGFAYDEVANELRDRRGQGLAELTQTEKLRVNEQKELLSEQTTKLFRQIIMTELVGRLKTQVFQLETQVQRINLALAQRTFGTQRYRFHLRVNTQYRGLVELIRRFNLLDAACEEELRQFFMDHQSDVLDAAVGEVPATLDYRNWYQYELNVTSQAGDGTAIDRQTKALGSGGEQAVPNYLLIIAVAHVHYSAQQLKLHTLLFDEAFYGIDAGRRDQLLGFATELGLQLFIASPEQDGVKQEIAHSTTLLVVKDEELRVHLYPFHWDNPAATPQQELLAEYQPPPAPLAFTTELGT